MIEKDKVKGALKGLRSTIFINPSLKILTDIIEAYLNGELIKREMIMVDKEDEFLKYRKPNNCSYPFQADGIDYCWGYAQKVDEGKEDEMDCTDCEYLSQDKTHGE